MCDLSKVFQHVETGHTTMNQTLLNLGYKRKAPTEDRRDATASNASPRTNTVSGGGNKSSGDSDNEGSDESDNEGSDESDGESSDENDGEGTGKSDDEGSGGSDDEGSGGSDDSGERDDESSDESEDQDGGADDAFALCATRKLGNKLPSDNRPCNTLIVSVFRRGKGIKNVPATELKLSKRHLVRLRAAAKMKATQAVSYCFLQTHR
jgi:hypothetical protein